MKRRLTALLLALFQIVSIIAPGSFPAAGEIFCFQQISEAQQ